MKLKLEMELDNDTMLEQGSIITMLTNIGRWIEDAEEATHPRTTIRDTNGNTIGFFKVE